MLIKENGVWKRDLGKRFPCLWIDGAFCGDTDCEKDCPVSSEGLLTEEEILIKMNGREDKGN